MARAPARVSAARIRANKDKVASYLGAGIIGAGGSPTARVFRAMGQGGYQTVNVLGIGAANRSQETRLIHRAQAKTNRIKARFALWRQTGSQPIKDISWLDGTTLGMKIASKFEPNPVQAVSGLGDGIPFLIGGAKFKRMDPTTWNFNTDGWIIETDVLEIADILGRYIEAGELFGEQTALAIDDNGGTHGNFVPRNRPLSNWLQRYCGSVTSAADVIGDGTGSFFSRKAFSSAGATRTGAGYGFVAFDYLFEVPKTMISLWTAADSVGQDQIIGQGNPALYDVMGDADANRSFVGIASKRLGIMQSGAERGSDGDKNLRTAANWLGRLQAMLQSGCTCIDLLTGLNDYNTLSQPGDWVANQVLGGHGAIRKTGGRVLMSTNPSSDFGTTGANAPSGTTAVGQTIVDGTVTWTDMGPYTGVEADKAYGALGNRYATIRIIREAFIAAGKVVPTIRISMPMLRAGTSSDTYATVENQTPDASFTAIRARLRELYSNATIRSIFRCSDDVVDVTLGTETAVNSGRMRTDGSGLAYISTTDLVHPYDIGHRELAALYPAPPALTAAQLAA